MPTDNSTPAQEKKKPADIALVIVIVLMVGVGIWMIIRENQSASQPADLPKDFVYNIDDLKKIDPSLVNFSENAQFDTGLETLLCLSLHNDNVYVGGKGGLKVFDSSGELIKELVRGEKVSSVWVQSEDKIFVGLGTQVVLLGKDGARIKEWESFDPKSNLRSIVGSKEHLYVGDAANRVVYVCDFEGKLIRKIANDPKTGLVVPGPHLDLQWNEQESLLYMANPGRHRIDAYTDAGELTNSWGKPSMRLEGFCGCCNPTSFALWPDGGFLTSEKGLTRIKRHEKDGSIKDVVATPKMFMKKTRIYDMDVDENGAVFVLDNDRKQVRIFKEKLTGG